MSDKIMHPAQQKNLIHCRRRDFFNEILAMLNKDPTRIDEIMGQAKYYTQPSTDGMILDPEMGNFMLNVSVGHAGFSYSLYQIGSTLKIGVLFFGATLTSPVDDPDGEIETLWPGFRPIISRRGDSVMYEWEFDEPDLYSNWARQEKYILGMRHAHFRILRIISETALEKKKDAA